MRVVGWLVLLVVAGAAALTLDPEILARVNPEWEGVTTWFPIAQVVALRTLLAAVFAVLAVLVLIIAVVRKIGFRGGTRSLLLALVLAAVAVGHGWVVWDRGTDNPGELIVDDGVRPGEAGTGALTVLALNAEGGATSANDVAVLADDNGVDVLALSETSAESAEEVAGLLAEEGHAFQVFTGTTDDESVVPATALLVSEELGEYLRTDDPATGFASVRAEPASGVGPVLVAAHTVPPVDDRDAWLADVETVMGLCQGRGTDRLILAGDLNATLDHLPLRDLGRCTSGTVDAAVGGVGTWPTSTPWWVGAGIDHVLHDAERYRTVAGAVVEVGGSDHRAVLVRLVPEPRD